MGVAVWLHCGQLLDGHTLAVSGARGGQSLAAPLDRRRYCLHVQVKEADSPTPTAVDIQVPEEILGADCRVKNHAVFRDSQRVHHS